MAKPSQGKARRDYWEGPWRGRPGQVKSENGNNLGHKRKKAINDENERERENASKHEDFWQNKLKRDGERGKERVSSAGALVLVKSCTDSG